MNIVFWSRLSFGRDLVIDRFEAEPGISFTVCPTLDACIAVLPAADGLVLYNCKPEEARMLMTAVAAEAPNLRWMHFLTAGYEGFDAVGFPARIEVTQTAGHSAAVVAEHAMALLLALGRRIPEVVEQTREQRWERPGVAARVSSLECGTMGIVGYGHVGRAVAARARAFGMTTIAVTRSGRGDEHVDEVHPLSSMDAVLVRSDVVVVAIALTPDTRHLIGEHACRSFKPGAFLVNVSRGAVIDSAALRVALATGVLAGAGLDVTDPEPLLRGDPLWDCPNLIVSPHIATEGSPPSVRRMADGALRLLRERLQRPAQ